MSSISDLIPFGVLSDSYKATHFQQYPRAKRLVAYGEFRTAFDRDTRDNRIALFGIRFIVERVLLRKWTLRDVELAEAFYKTHKAPDYSEFPFPKHLFEKFINENDGRIRTPVTLSTSADSRVLSDQVRGLGGRDLHPCTCSRLPDHRRRRVQSFVYFPGVFINHDLVPDDSSYSLT